MLNDQLNHFLFLWFQLRKGLGKNFVLVLKRNFKKLIPSLILGLVFYTYYVILVHLYQMGTRKLSYSAIPSSSLRSDRYLIARAQGKNFISVGA